VELASFLEKTLRDRLTAVQFSPKVKSELGWDWGHRDRPLPRLHGGRWAGHAPILVRGQALAAQTEIRRGPGQAMRWGVWETPAYDGLVARGHDDLLVSAALVAILD
jgi:hypothetical protein